MRVLINTNDNVVTSAVGHMEDGDEIRAFPIVLPGGTSYALTCYRTDFVTGCDVSIHLEEDQAIALAESILATIQEQRAKKAEVTQ